jgi:hypothetical protein
MAKWIEVRRVMVVIAENAEQVMVGSPVVMTMAVVMSMRVNDMTENISASMFLKKSASLGWG